MQIASDRFVKTNPSNGFEDLARAIEVVVVIRKGSGQVLSEVIGRLDVHLLWTSLIFRGLKKFIAPPLRAIVDKALADIDINDTDVVATTLASVTLGFMIEQDAKIQAQLTHLIAKAIEEKRTPVQPVKLGDMIFSSQTTSESPIMWPELMTFDGNFMTRVLCEISLKQRGYYIWNLWELHDKGLFCKDHIDKDPDVDIWQLVEKFECMKVFASDTNVDHFSMIPNTNVVNLIQSYDVVRSRATVMQRSF